MTLADLINPDRWIASGMNLVDFPWPADSDHNERQAMNLILANHPQLRMHLGRWGSRIAECGGGSQKLGDVLSERRLRELWELTRATALS
jgi:hypothetical protein